MISEQILLPEKFPNLKLFKNFPVCSMQIKRTYQITTNSCFKFSHAVSDLNDDGNLKVYICDKEYEFSAFEGIIKKYVLLNCCVIIKPLKLELGGYFWAGFSCENLFTVETVKNLWDSGHTMVKDGIRVLHVPTRFEFVDINSKNECYNLYIYTDTPIYGDFEVTVIKTINYTPIDRELTIPKINEEIQNDFINTNYNNNIITRWKS